jgi:formylglycine-generating enzyme required for sulfatase activity
MSGNISDQIKALESNQEGAIERAVSILSSGEGTSVERLSLSIALGKAGDPRLSSPEQDSYWKEVDLGYEKILVGQFPVTMKEWKIFVDSTQYNDDSFWSEEGLVWRDKARPSWQKLSKSPEVAGLIIDNHPVVGVSWFEAQAYANAHGARLPDFNERVDIIRGTEKRHYPWGAPFGHGNSNTKEEALGQTCGVGIFVRDQIPEGVCDLVGNVSEWTAGDFEGKAVIHPGSWSQDMMSSWPKASKRLSTAARLDNLGFRLVKDI